MTNAAAHPRIALDDLAPEDAPPVLKTFVELAEIPSQARDEGRVATWCRGYLEGLRARVFEARRGHGRVRAITIDECLPPGPAATAFESFFHARNLASIEERGLYPEAA